MSQTLPALWNVLVVAALAVADPVAIKLPSEIKADVGDWITVRADTEGKIVRWVPLTPGLKVFPAELLKDTKATVVTSQKPGRYQLLAYTAKGDEPSEPAICVIVIGQPGPNPPPDPPGPGPGPNPPTPPDDPLTKRIRDALASDPGTAADKHKHAAALAGFYEAMASQVKMYADTTTVGDLQSDYRAAIPSVLPADAIPATRKVAGLEVAAVVGDDAERKLDAGLKAKLVDLFTRLAAALATVSNR